jgi:hypothetical protein
VFPNFGSTLRVGHGMNVDAPKTVSETRRNAINELYRQFGRYSFPHAMQPDPAFPGFCDDGPLRAAELPKLPAEAFQRYAWKAVTTWGSVNDFKHFLPRILELIALGETGIAFDAASTLEKLNYGRWRTWPSSEQVAIEAYLFALWDTWLRQPIEVYAAIYESYCEAYFWLDRILKIDDRPAGYLTLWRERLESQETRVLSASQLCAGYLSVWHPNFVSEPDWIDGSPAANRLLIEWFANPRTSELLQDAFFCCEQPEVARVISDGIEWLAKWKLARSEQP